MTIKWRWELLSIRSLFSKKCVDCGRNSAEVNGLITCSNISWFARNILHQAICGSCHAKRFPDTQHAVSWSKRHGLDLPPIITPLGIFLVWAGYLLGIPFLLSGQNNTAMIIFGTWIITWCVLVTIAVIAYVRRDKGG